MDRIDLGLGSMEEEPIPFFTPPRELTLEEYKADSNINFYNTILGLPSLEADTGIDVDPGDDITDLADPSAGSDRDDSDRPDILSMQVFGGGGQYANEPVFQSEGTSFDSYSDYLKSTGSTGRLPFVENILDPITQGEMPKFAAQAQASFKEGVEDVKAVPAQSKSVIENLVNTGQISQEQAQDLMKGILPVAGGLVGAGAAGLIGGETVQNAFGMPSFRPAGAMGMMADIVHTIQYRDMAYNRAVSAAYSQGDMAGSEFGPMDFSKVDTGFSMLIGTTGITRKAGSGVYTGNTHGMGIERLKALEAISQGYDPTKGFSVTNPGAGVKVEDSGGSFVSNNTMDGFYRANGTFYDPRTGVSAAMGNMSHLDALASKTFGVTVSYKNGIGMQYNRATSNALKLARSGVMTLQEALALEVAKLQPEKTPKSDEDGSGGSPTFTSGGIEYEVGTGAGQVDPGLAKGVGSYNPNQSAGDDKKSDEAGAGGGGGDPLGTSRDPGYTGGPRAFGGIIGYAPGGAVAQGGSGFINRPPEQVSEAESVADNQPDAVPEGTFIINAAAVEFAGSDDIRKMLVTAHKEAIRRGITVDKDGKGAKLIDVALSSGEVKIAPYLAKIIGYDRLNKINNRGKPEVEERIRENGQDAPPGTMRASLGGFLSQGFGQQRATPQVTAPQEPSAATPLPTPESYGNEQPPRQGFVERPDMGADVPDVELQAPPEFVSQLEEHYKKPVTRTRNEKLYKNMNDTQLLAHMIMAETKSSVAPERAMYAVGNTVLHRVASDRPEFKKQTSPRDVILKRLSKGAYEYVGMDVTRNRGLKENFKDDRASYEKGLARATAVAEDLLSGEMEGNPTVPSDVMWYTRKDAPNQWMRKNLILVETIGEHEFYKAPD